MGVKAAGGIRDYKSNCDDKGRCFKDRHQFGRCDSRGGVASWVSFTI